MASLTEKVLHYQKTREGLHEIVNELAPRVYHYPRRKMGWDEDACGDFYVFIHPRLIRLLDRFRDQGKPFETYLWAVLNWQLRNFARERKKGERSWNVSLRLNTMDVDDTEEVHCESLRMPDGIASVLRSDADRRNLLFLVLKCSRTIEPENAIYLASMAGITAGRLLSLATDLRQMRAHREKRLETFRSRRNNAFAQSRVIETELLSEVNPLRIATLKTMLERTRRRMKSAMARMARVGLAPTNREIALVLGIPKGTVDSGLYWLKRKLGSVYDPDNLRSA